MALAREAGLGREYIMAVSTVGGKGQAKPLPIVGVQEIYHTIFALCPSFQHNAEEFDKKVWAKCKTALNHACNRLRC